MRPALPALAFPGLLTLCLLACPALAQDKKAARNLSRDIVASAVARGNWVELDIRSPEGWVCSTTIRKTASGSTRSSSSRSQGGGGSSRSGSSSSGELASPVRFDCSDGTRARGQVRLNASRGEWEISFRHGTHGTALLRAREG